MLDVELTKLAEIDIAENPKRLGVKSVANRQNYYCYHLSNNTRNVKGQRVKKLSHLLIFYRQRNNKLIVARLLHERMLIERYIH